MPKILLPLLATSIVALAIPAMAVAPLLSHDFESSIPGEWSTKETVIIDGDTALGPFNSRTKLHARKARLKLEGLPAGTDLLLSFDLILLGKWDEEGTRADSFALYADGELLLEVLRFPCDLGDEAENLPAGTPGAAKVDNRWLGSCVLPQQVTIPSSVIQNGELKLTFKGTCSGRRSEFWAVDNVMLTPAP